MIRQAGRLPATTSTRGEEEVVSEGEGESRWRRQSGWDVRREDAEEREM